MNNKLHCCLVACSCLLEMSISNGRAVDTGWTPSGDESSRTRHKTPVHTSVNMTRHKLRRAACNRHVTVHSRGTLIRVVMSQSASTRRVIVPHMMSFHYSVHNVHWNCNVRAVAYTSRPTNIIESWKAILSTIAFTFGLQFDLLELTSKHLQLPRVTRLPALRSLLYEVHQLLTDYLHNVIWTNYTSRRYERHWHKHNTCSDTQHHFNEPTHTM